MSAIAVIIAVVVGFVAWGVLTWMVEGAAADLVEGASEDTVKAVKFLASFGLGATVGKALSDA